MATVNGVSSSNLSSLYGNRNVLSGLASGLDTESMIENSVSGIRLKISGIEQKQTKLEWKQEAYRNLIDMMVQFTRKYTSYTSSTNLLSASFFNNAVITAANGANAEKVSATGRTGSDVRLNGVAQLASASRYQVASGGVLDAIHQNPDGSRKILAGAAVELTEETEISKLSGTLSLTYGQQELTLTFDEGQVFDTAADFAAAIRDQLAQQTVSFSGGGSQNADQVIRVDVSADGKISFSDQTGGNNSVYVSGATGKLRETLGSPDFSGSNRIPSLDLGGKALKESVVILDQVAGKSMSFALNGTSKTIALATKQELQSYINDNGGTEADAMTALLQKKLDNAFGQGKVTVSNDTLEAGKLQLGFTVGSGSNLTVNSQVNTALELRASESTYLDTGRTLGDLLGGDLGGLTGGKLLLAEGSITRNPDGSYVDAKGNKVNAQGQRLGSDGELLYQHDLKLGGVTIGSYTRDTALETVLRDIGNNTEAGLSVSYSQTTNQFVFTAKETGAGHNVEFGAGLAESIFGAFDPANYTEGKDAIVHMTVNGSDLTVTRSTNTFNVDGLTLSLKGTFNGSVDTAGAVQFDFLDAQGQVDASLLTDPVTFSTTADTDKIVDAVKTMVEDYNAILTALREAFNTVPAQKSNGSRYEPLTEADREGMTETAIANYEAQAKQGLLFADGDLSSLYSKLVSSLAPGGTDGAALRAMGITTQYSQGLTTISLDEAALRNALGTNPDSVRDAFSKVAGEGSATNGLMQNMKRHLDTYASAEGTKGVLVNKAGSKYSAVSLLDNSLKKQQDNYQKQIDALYEKLSSKVDYYTRQFTRLEQLVAQMNAQSSSIMGLMMGGQGQQY